MALSLLGLAAAYLVGAIPVGVLVSRLAGGVDIRRQGSGNIGGTVVKSVEASEPGNRLGDEVLD